MKTVIVFLLLSGGLAGCASQVAKAIGSLPSVQMCQHVVYERTGNTFKASVDTCSIPIEQGVLSGSLAGAVNEATALAKP